MSRLLPVLVVLVLGACSRDLDLPVTPLRGAISGSVELQGGPAAGVPVTLVRPSGARTPTTSDDSGAFAFDDLPPGTYSVRVEPAGYAPALELATVSGGQTTALGVLRPVRLATTLRAVRGRVVPPDGVDGVAGAVVRLTRTGESRPQAQVALGLDGLFVVEVAPGTWDIAASHPSFTTAAALAQVVGADADLELAQPLQLGLDPASITGAVLREVDGAAPAPAANATVTADPFGANAVVAADGTFTIGGLPPGDYQLRLGLADHSPAGAPPSVHVDRGQTVDAGTLQLALDRGTLAGVVEMADGLTSRDTTVAISGTGYGAVVSPELANPARGAFRIGGVPVGLREVVARKNGYLQAVRSSVSVRASATTDVGVMTLAVQQGNVSIDDGDPTSAPGYTRTPDVTVSLGNATGAARVRLSEDPAFAGASFVAFSGAALPFRLSVRDGTHVVYAQYEDALGVRSATFQSAVVLDSVAPDAVTLTLQSGAPFTSQAAALNVTVEAREQPAPQVDQVSGLAALRLSPLPPDGGVVLGAETPWQRDLLWSRPTLPDGGAPADGPVELFVQVLDRAGNASAPVSAHIVVDTAPPAGTVAIARGRQATIDGLTNETTASVELTAASEPWDGGVRVRLASSTQALATAQPVDLVSPISWPLAADTDGTKTVYAQFLDSAGNLSAPLAATVVLDRAPPSPATVSLVGSSNTNQASVSLTLAASDSNGLSPTAAVAASESLLFDGPIAPQAFPGSGTLSFPLSAGNGPKTIYVRFRDGAGNDALRSVAVTRDDEAPTGALALEGTLADGATSAAYTSTPGITAIVGHQGATEYLLVAGPLASCAGATGYQALPSNLRIPLSLPAVQGAQTVRLCLRDAAGNVSGGVSAVPYSATISLASLPLASCTPDLVGARADGSTTLPLPAGKTGQRLITVNLATCPAAATEVFLTTGAVSCTPAAPLDWARSAATASLLLAGPDGLTTVRGCLRDAARNVATLGPATIDLDTTPPQAPSVLVQAGAEYLTAPSRLASISGAASGAAEWAVGEDSLALTNWSPLASSNPRNLTLGGEGARTVFARFRDDVGNVSAVANDGITVDTVAPTAGTVSLLGSLPGFTNSEVIVAQLTAPADVAGVQLAQAANAACATSDFPSAAPGPMLPSLTFVLSGIDGTKRVCARFFDAAGNVSTSLASATITLDRVAPTAPRITTAAQLVRQGNNTSFSVTIAGAVTETNFLRFERLGGLDPSAQPLTQWTTAPGPNGQTTFFFRLAAGSAPQGTANVLRLRAVDSAGNTGPEDSVIITADPVLPQAVTLSTTGVDNRDGSAVVYWRLPAVPDPDLAGFRVYYGPNLYNLTGTGLPQGASPFLLPATATSAALTGLPNGSTSYVTVRAVDLAGNEAPAPTSPSTVLVAPNAYSPSLIADVSFEPTMTDIFRMVVDRDGAWLVGGTCTADVMTTVLGWVSLADAAAPFQRGTLTATPWTPTLTAVRTFTGRGTCDSVRRAPPDLVVDGPWGYLTSGSAVHFLRLDGAAPTSVGSVALSGPVSPLALGGRRLFVGGAGFISALRLDPLFDGVPGTVPTGADVVGTHTDGFLNSGALGLGRNRLLRTAADSSSRLLYDVSSTLAGGGFGIGNSWGTPSLVAPVPLLGAGPMVVDGNHVLVPGQDFLRVASLNGAWAAVTGPVTLPTVADGPLASGWGVSISGPWAFGVAPNSDIVTIAELSRAASGEITAKGAFSQATGAVYPSQTVVATHGQYLLTAAAEFFGSRPTHLRVYEAAQPVGLHVSRRVGRGAAPQVMAGGMLLGRSVIDLHGDLAERSTPAEFSTFDGYASRMALFGEQAVFNQGTNAITVVELEQATDRDGVALSAAADSYTVTLGPAGTKALDLAAWGEFLLVLEQRPTTGIWLRAFRATALRDRVPATRLQASDAVPGAEVQVASFSPTEAMTGVLTVARGRAVVALSHGSSYSSPQPSPAITFWDLRPWFDDDAATTAAIAQGSIATQRSVRNLAVSGSRLWAVAGRLGTYEGVHAWDVSALLDEDPSSLATPASPLVLVSQQEAEGLLVVGSWVFVSSYETQGSPEGVFAIDFSNLTFPRVGGMVPELNARSLNLAGNRLYLSTSALWASPGTTVEVELE